MPVRARSRAYRRCALAAGVGCLYLGLIALVVFSVGGTGDFGTARPVGGDNAGPGLAALVHLDVAGYLSHQPMMGLTSILLRLPAAAVAAHFRAGALASYQLEVMACLIPLALLAAWLAGAEDLSLDRRICGLAALLVLILSPVTRTALGAGHPEGLLAGTLGVAAVIAATRGQARAAAVLLGLAIGSQDWGLMAAPPVLIALRGRRREVLVLSAAVAALLTVSVWLGDPAGFLRAVDSESATRFLTPLSLLWPVSIPLHLPNASVEWVRAMPLGMRRPEATLLGAALLGAICGAWYLGLRRRIVGVDPLALLALLGLLRCVVDSTHEEYYAIAALIPILAWEARQNRLPVIGTLISVRAWASFGAIGHMSATYLYLTSLGMKVLLVGYFLHRAVVLVPKPVSRPAVHPISELVGAVWIAGENTLPAAGETEPARAAA